MNTKVIIYDMDETLVDNEFKSNGAGFLWALEGDRALQEICLRIILSDPNWRKYSRFEFMRQVLVKSGRRDESLTIDDSEVLGLTDRFKEVLKEENVKRGLYPDVYETLDLLNRKGVMQYIVSGSTHETVIDTIEHLNIKQFLEGFYGNGWRGVVGAGLDKQAGVDEVVNKHPDVPRDEFLVVGDAVGDFNLATHIGCPFAGIPRPFTNNWPEVVDPKGIEHRADMIAISSAAKVAELINVS